MELGKIEVSGINARTVYRKAIPKGIVGATVEIEYADPIWDSLTKTVVFWGCCVKDVLNPGTVVEIPAEVVEAAGYRLRVGVYGVDAENNLVIPTLWADLGYIEYSADPSGDETTDPTLPVWAQMDAKIDAQQEQIGDLNELETEDKSSLVAAINSQQKQIDGFESGGSGVHILKDGETLDDVPEHVNVVIDPSGEAEEPPVTSVNGQTGDVVIEIPEQKEYTVNGNAADENGNFQIDIPEGFSGSWNDLFDKPDIPTDEHINELINAALGVIENGTY